MSSQITWEWYHNRKRRAKQESNRRRARIAAEQFKRRCLLRPGWAFAWGAVAGSMAMAVWAALWV